MALDEHVGGAGQLLQGLLILRRIQVEGYTAFIRVLVPEENAAVWVRIIFEVRPAPALLAALRWFDLDHIGAKVGEKLGSIRSPSGREVENAQIAQGCGS